MKSSRICVLVVTVIVYLESISSVSKSQSVQQDQENIERQEGDYKYWEGCAKKKCVPNTTISAMFL